MSDDRKGELVGWNLLYAFVLFTAPFVALALWFSAFGFSNGDPVSLRAIPAWLALAAPPAIGLAIGWRVAGFEERARWAVLIAPGLLVSGIALYAAANGTPADGVALVSLLVAAYAFGPVALGWGLRQVRGGGRRSPGAKPPQDPGRPPPDLQADPRGGHPA